jgi:hypothetical protein
MVLHDGVLQQAGDPLRQKKRKLHKPQRLNYRSLRTEQVKKTALAHEDDDDDDGLQYRPTDPRLRSHFRLMVRSPV